MSSSYGWRDGPSSSFWLLLFLLIHLSVFSQFFSFFLSSSLSLSLFCLSSSNIFLCVCVCVIKATWSGCFEATISFDLSLICSFMKMMFKCVTVRERETQTHTHTHCVFTGTNESLLLQVFHCYTEAAPPSLSTRNLVTTTTQLDAGMSSLRRKPITLASADTHAHTHTLTLVLISLWGFPQPLCSPAPHLDPTSWPETSDPDLIPVLTS